MQKNTAKCIDLVAKWISKNMRNKRSEEYSVGKEIEKSTLGSLGFLISIFIVLAVFAWNNGMVYALEGVERTYSITQKARDSKGMHSLDRLVKVEERGELEARGELEEKGKLEEKKDFPVLVSTWEQGLSLYREGKYELALIFFERAFVENPLRVDLHFYLGNLYHHKEQYEKAVEAYSRGLELANEREREVLLLNLAQSYQAMGNSEEALKLYEEIDSDVYPQVYLHRGMLYLEQGQREKVEVSWKKYLELEPDSAQKESIQKALILLGDPGYILPIQEEKQEKKQEVISGARGEEEPMLSKDSLESSEPESLSEEDIQAAEEQLITQLREQEQSNIQQEIEKSSENIQIESKDLVVSELDRKEGEEFEEIER